MSHKVPKSLILMGNAPSATAFERSKCSSAITIIPKTLLKMSDFSILLIHLTTLDVKKLLSELYIYKRGKNYVSAIVRLTPIPFGCQALLRDRDWSLMQ